MTRYSQTGTSTGELYGFPRTSDGLIKFGFRGAKWTNYAFNSNSGRIISHPKTEVQTIPTRAMDVIRAFCKENLPELLTLPIQKGGFAGIRIRWTTTSLLIMFRVRRDFWWRVGEVDMDSSSSLSLGGTSLILSRERIRPTRDCLSGGMYRKTREMGWKRELQDGELWISSPLPEHGSCNSPL
jgi:hypothetical protein